jgi:TonB family protein
MAVLAVLAPAPAARGVAAAGAVAMQAASWPGRVLSQQSMESSGPLALCWAAGALLSLCWFAAQQRRFGRQLVRRAGDRFDTAPAHGPAVVGWWRPRIVLPEDFRERYTRGEQRLVLAHEIAHLRRGDIHAQALATGLRCLFWFNPLVHYAAARFRFDQELACDASVLARFPRGRGRYGRAMLKTQLAGFGLPVGCHWQSSHPLKERIAMLKLPLPARAQRLSGSLAIGLLAVATSYAAWATQPKAPPPRARLAAHSEVEAIGTLAPPAFPAGAAGLDGKVVLELLVGVDGRVRDARVVQSQPAGVFDQASIAAALQWRMRPALEKGRPVEQWVRVPVEFRSDGVAPKD